MKDPKLKEKEVGQVHDIFTIDIHNHILPEKWPDLKKRYGYGGFIRLDHHQNCKARMMKDDQFFREVQDNLWGPRVRQKDCDRDGVNVQVLSTVPVMFSYWAKPEDTLELSGILNDHIASVVEDYPSRFIGLGTLPMQAPELAIRELERIINDLGLAGVEIGSHINWWNLNDPALYPFWEAAQELGAAIFVHPWDMMGKEEMKDYWLPWLVGMPAETSRAICSMIFGGIFEKYPRLRVAFAHGGGAFPSTIGRIEHGWKVRPDLCAVDNNINPKNYLGKFYLDSLVHDPEVLKYLVQLMGKEKIALGTDYPFPLGELEPGSLIDKTPFDRDTKEWLFYRSAIEWLDLPENKRNCLGID